jgi:hypothetical protein
MQTRRIVGCKGAAALTHSAAFAARKHSVPIRLLGARDWTPFAPSPPTQ